MSTELRRLGQTDIEITPIGQGVMQFAGRASYFRWIFEDMGQAEMNDIVQTALDGGINWFDTAELYGWGRSEEGLARALDTVDLNGQEPVIATKWWPILRTAASIAKTIDDRRRYLGGRVIDLHYIHQPYSFSSPEAEMAEMADLYEAGHIRSVGVSNFSAARMRRAYAALAKRGLPLAANQVRFSLIDREIERNGILELAKELGVTLVAWGPLGSGILSGRYHRDPDALSKVPLGRRIRFSRQVEKTRPLVEAMMEMADGHGVTVAQVALNWAIHVHEPTVVAIPGASSVRQAQQNAAVMDFRLSEAEMKRLDELSRGY